MHGNYRANRKYLVRIEQRCIKSYINNNSKWMSVRLGERTINKTGEKLTRFYSFFFTSFHYIANIILSLVDFIVFLIPSYPSF